MSTLPRLTRQTPTAPIGIVHLGPGAFFRAFMGSFTHDAMAAAGGDWGILAVSLRSAGPRDQLAPQRGVYTGVTLAPEGPSFDQITAISDILVAPEDPGAVVAAMARKEVQIVSLTITEKGYCHAPATGDLNLDHPDIAHDLAQPEAPRSAVGFLVRALAVRHAAGLPPFTVLSCDNLPDNGALTRRVVLRFAEEVSPDLAAWIAEEGRFPATMVDRITPATTPEDIAALAEAQGYEDLACVSHEPFRQWVIEDDFVGSTRPAWEAAGAQLVADVAAHETMKLRCLNGTHSALAYLGYLSGHETIADCAADPVLRQFCQDLWTAEILPTVAQPQGEDLPAYCAALMARYENPSIRHRTWQIAMDGSQKLPQRLLGTIADNLAAGRDISRLALAVAAWMCYVGGIDEAGEPIDVRDPLAEHLRAVSDSAEDPEERVRALLGVQDVFDPNLAENEDFAEAVTKAYLSLCAKGARATMATIEPIQA